MDHELKQRLIGAIVVTALAAIFIPMLFDDPVDTSGQKVSELTLPKAPENLAQTAEKKLPEDFGQALTAPDQDATASPNGNTEETAQTETPVDDELVATETDTENLAPSDSAKAKPSADTLDTGEVLEADKSDDSEPVAVTEKPEHAKATHTVTEAKTPKKPKTVEADSHKASVKPEEDAEDSASPKTKTATKKAGSGLSRWSIQAGSFSKKENAEAMLKKLQQQGFPVTLQSKGDIYRIKIGPELDKQRAVDMKKRLEKQNIQSLMIAE